MKIYTGNFANVKKYRANGLFPVSIALTARYFSGALYRPLNPAWSFKNDPEPKYTPKFNDQLKKLDPKKVVEDLRELSENTDVVLLCHEGEHKFCHRQLVAAWLEQSLNIEVKELGKMQHEIQL